MEGETDGQVEKWMMWMLCSEKVLYGGFVINCRCNTGGEGSRDVWKDGESREL